VLRYTTVVMSGANSRGVGGADAGIWFGGLGVAGG
jgi:hypothetical protein